MSIQDLGSLGELIAALATIATLLYLAVQIRQTNSIARTDGTERLLQRFDDANQLLVVNESLRGALYKTTGHTEDELKQIYSFANFKCNLCLSAQSAYSAGRIDKELFDSVKKDMLVSVQMWPAIQDAFQEWCDRYPDVSSLEVFDQL